MTSSILNLSDCLNLDQSSTELNNIYGDMDYYWYLRSIEFRNAFLAPLGKLLSADPRYFPILDVGCGEGQLADYIDHNRNYSGMDGSLNGVIRGKKRDRTLNLVYGRIEYPLLSFSSGERFSTLVFGGILSVPIKLEKRERFIREYVKQFQSTYVVIYDMVTLDTSFMSHIGNKIGGFENRVEMEGIEDVKKTRKVEIYQCR